MKYGLLFFIIFIIIISCNNDYNNKDINNPVSKNEIEPNDIIEYSQFIDANSYINASFSDSNDIDYYRISPTNGFIMDFSISVYDEDANIQFELFENSNILFQLKSKDIADYNANINLNDIIFETNEYFLCLKSDRESKYSLNFIFKDDIIINNEKEPNNLIINANDIKSPNELIYGYFIKNNFDMAIDEYIIPYIKSNTNIIDIDCYKIENTTDIDASINIILQNADNVDMILFDENFNYIKTGKNNITYDFFQNKIYYIALICYSDKSILKRYSLHYEFN